MELKPLLSRVLSHLESEDPKYARKVRAQLRACDQTFHDRAESLFERYKSYIEICGKQFEYGIECYLKLRESMMWESLQFHRTGEYSNKSFEDVNLKVYDNPFIMKIHMHGLVFAQFLWPDQYRRFSFFCEFLSSYQGHISRYLEIGGGHALYITEALKCFGLKVKYDLVDISLSSIELARGIAGHAGIEYHHRDIFSFPSYEQYDFISMGEVLEHVESPITLLHRVRKMLRPDGCAFISTPANSPTIDHIFLFHNASEIRSMLCSAGFKIDREVTQYGEDLPPAEAELQKVPLMYAAFVRIV